MKDNKKPLAVILLFLVVLFIYILIFRNIPKPLTTIANNHVYIALLKDNNTSNRFIVITDQDGTIVYNPKISYPVTNLLWSPDNQNLLIETGYQPSKQFTIYNKSYYLFNTQNNTLSYVTSYSSSATFDACLWKDNNTLIFMQDSELSFDSNGNSISTPYIYTFSLINKKTTRLITFPTQDVSIVTPDRTSLPINLNLNSNPRLNLVDNNSKLLINIGTSNNHYYTLDLKTHKLSDFLTLPIKNKLNVAISGNAITYVDPNNPNTIIVKKLTGEQKQVTVPQSEAFDPQFGPNDNSIIYYAAIGSTGLTSVNQIITQPISYQNYSIYDIALNGTNDQLIANVQSNGFSNINIINSLQRIYFETTTLANVPNTYGQLDKFFYIKYNSSEAKQYTNGTYSFAQPNF